MAHGANERTWCARAPIRQLRMRWCTATSKVEKGALDGKIEVASEKLWPGRASAQRLASSD